MNIDYKQEFMNGFKTLLRNKHPYEVWKDMVTLFAIEINNTTMRVLKSMPEHEKVWHEREARYKSIAKTYNKKEGQ